MNKLKSLVYTLPLSIILIASAVSGTVNAATGNAAKANDGVVKIVSGGRTGTYLRLTDEMKSVLPKYADKQLRVVPMIGLGSQKNLNDLLYLKGVDIALLQSDVMASAKSKYGDLENRVRYITKLHDEEVHILARKSVKSIYDLKGKKVSIGNASSGTAMTAKLIFDTLKVKADLVHFSATDALKELSKRNGIDAFVYISGKPVDLFNSINKSTNFHFIDIPSGPLSHIYKPSVLTSKDYKNLVESPVKTVAAQAVLAVYNFKKDKSSRYEYIQRFVESLFKAKDELSLPKNKYHSKWQTINLCEEVPGWKKHSSVIEIYKTFCSKSLVNNDSKGLPPELFRTLMKMSAQERTFVSTLSKSQQIEFLKLKK